MASKRSMSEVMKLSKEQMAFIRPALSKPIEFPMPEPAEEETTTKSNLNPTPSDDAELATDAKPLKRQARPRAKDQGAPDPADVLAKIRRPYSTSLPLSTQRLLKRFCFEQDQIGGELKEQQLVVDLALCEFFKSRGLLD
jgi:hypothetical protein